MCTIQVLGLGSSINGFIAPTHPRMSTQATSRLCITCIQEAMHIMAVLPLAVGGRAFKDVDSMAVDIFDSGHAIEEHIDWRSLIFCKMV